jgi:hypothetical protein
MWWWIPAVSDGLTPRDQKLQFIFVGILFHQGAIEYDMHNCFSPESKQTKGKDNGSKK